MQFLLRKGAREAFIIHLKKSGVTLGDQLNISSWIIFSKLADVKRGSNPVTRNMIPEVRLRRFAWFYHLRDPKLLVNRQVPKHMFGEDYLDLLRPFSSTWNLPGHVGSRPGHKGKPTYFYSGVFEILLNISEYQILYCRLSLEKSLTLESLTRIMRRG